MKPTITRWCHQLSAGDTIVLANGIRVTNPSDRYPIRLVIETPTDLNKSNPHRAPRHEQPK